MLKLFYNTITRFKESTRYRNLRLNPTFNSSFKARKSNRQRKSNCKAELEGINLEFADDDKDLVLLPAMEGDALEEVFPDLDGEWGVNPNKKTILSTRANQFPDE